MICATAIAIGLHLGTYHFDRSKDYNETNPGAYVQCDGKTAGYYYNSEKRHSFYAGYTWQKGPWALTVGGVTGYDRGVRIGGERVSVMLIPSVRVGAVRIGVIPPVGKIDGGVHVAIEF
jgi:hypothetical protein